MLYNMFRAKGSPSLRKSGTFIRSARSNSLASRGVIITIIIITTMKITARIIIIIMII